jgi:hypothetical protein
LVSGRRKRRDFRPVVPEHTLYDQALHAACVEGDVDVSPWACAEDELDEGVASVTMAYVLLIDLMVVCPVIRLISVSMKENARRR